MSFRRCVEVVDALQIEARQDEIRLGVPEEDRILFEAWLAAQVNQGPRRAWERRIAAEALALAAHALRVHACSDDPTVPNGKIPGETEH